MALTLFFLGAFAACETKDMRGKHFAGSGFARLHPDDMIAEAGIHHRSDFTHSGVIRCLFKWPGIAVGKHYTHKPSALGRVFVGGVTACRIFVAYGAAEYGIAHRISKLLGSGFVLEHDMAYGDVVGTVGISLADKTVFHSLRAQIGCGKVVAVFYILLLYFREFRNTGMLGIRHLELIVDKQLQIIVNRLFLNLLCRIFFIEILEFADSDIASVISTASVFTSAAIVGTQARARAQAKMYFFISVILKKGINNISLCLR